MKITVSANSNVGPSRNGREWNIRAAQLNVEPRASRSGAEWAISVGQLHTAPEPSRS
jgi:hypothetical protein